MRLDRNLAPGSRNCKIKPVDPAFRSVSIPRQPKDLHVVGPVYRESPLGSTKASVSASNGSAERPNARPQDGPIREAWNSLCGLAAGPGTSVEQANFLALSEVA